MSRYLTPSKVALLCLIAIYTEGVVSNSSAIHVLSFLISCLIPLDAAESSSSSSSKWERQGLIDIADFEDVLSSHASSIPGRSIWDLFLRKIWSLDSCDALEVFFAEISSLLMKTREEQIQDRNNGLAPETGSMRLSRCSPLGAFVRRAQLEFTRLQFHDSVKLWRGFVRYRLPTYHLWARKHPSEEQAAVDINLLELGLDQSSHLAQAIYGNVEDDYGDENAISTKDVERLLEFQVGELQRLGGRVPDEMRSKLEQVLASGATIPSLVHYLRFLDAWKAGDYPSSFDNLHRYFDYTMQSHDRSFYQYALLNLAVLQSDFGCYGEAVSAMQEAVSIARESHDMNCLNFCMSWLYHFGKAFPEHMKDVQNTGMLGNEKEGLVFLKAKAKETEMWSLLSTTLLSEAKLELQNGESLASALENVVRASHLNVTKGLTSSTGPQLLLQTALYARIGVTHLSWLSTEIFRECYGSRAPLEDYLKSTFRNCQLLAQKGRYKEALARINQISPDTLRSLKANQHWVFFSGFLQLKWQINRDDKVAAEHLLTQLQSIQVPDNDLSLLLVFLTIEYVIRSGDYGRALKLLEKSVQAMQPETFDVNSQVKLLCLKARIFEKSGQPQRGFSLAMRAANIAYRSRLLPGLWEAITVLAGVLLSLREFEATNEMVESIMPQVLEFEDCDLAARAYSLLVDANMGMAGTLRRQTKADSPACKEYMTRAMGYADCAYDQYEQLEDIRGQCEIMAKKATLMHLTADRVLANDYAAKYLDLRKQANLIR
ncbi:hypothetical protein ASPZODRAFT_136263 [Penicilliopsis zonata CBS 506.65]|uniref:Anaphase-promoting complex subunit 5 n=1 Tax=Penicilliopsis zonata CBS 506.65 TaxID=1073090 RepID=A0A1L9S8C9_9EURO|nr:hypothetical protein ASPZODRAFT_136263 [Penicilliopsis zonata CBS 506.65]OJJ43409.1 hypothetical protein ASPZODRAFT_136263 [Penicilliopsis zonata CBS 506.65]